MQGRKLTDMFGRVLGLKFPTDKGQLAFCVKAKTLINNYNYNLKIAYQIFSAVRIRSKSPTVW